MSRKLLFSTVAGVGVLVGLANLDTTAQAANVDVNASVVAACTLVANPLAFGNYVNGQASAKDGQADVSYDCASGLDITLNLSAGGSGSEAARVMTSPTTGESLSYNLYQNSGRTTIWGTGASGINVNPTPGGGAQLHTIFGQIPATLAVTPATDYADIVVFDLAVN